MRHFILLAMFALCSAAEVEQITLADGRHLVGTYDDIAGTITLDGPGAAVIKVKRYDVKTREAYARPPAPVAKDEAPARPVEKAVDPIDGVWRAFAEATDIRARAEDAARATEDAAVLKWVASIDLSLLPVPALGADPRQSEIDAKRQIEHDNYRRGMFALKLQEYTRFKAKGNTTAMARSLMDMKQALRNELQERGGR